MGTLHSTISQVRDLDENEWQFVGGGSTTGPSGPTFYTSSGSTYSVVGSYPGQPDITGEDDSSEDQHTD